jgi:hypothetical protein
MRAKTTTGTLNRPKPAGIYYGTTAEWIIERKPLCDQCSIGPLTEFSSTQAEQVGEAEDWVNHQWHNFHTERGIIL